MASPLEDLDELALRCRDDKARLYIGEAVASYRSGAFRSTIVACWIAVCFDVIEKLRELALGGDAEAERHVQELETTRRSGDVTRALKFERELLNLAKDKFELISPLEYIDLERLQADRNRCAHPSLTSDDQAYAPSAELARLHIHSAVTHLLQHPPAQGKYALDRLIKEVESEYFPTDGNEAKIAFASGPLKRPRESLVRNFIIVMLKGFLNEKPDYKRRMRISAALKATAHLQQKIFSTTLREKLPAMFRAISDNSLNVAIYFLRDIEDTWQYLEDDNRQRLERYVVGLPTRDYDDIDFLLKYQPLRTHALQRVNASTLDENVNALLFGLPAEACDRVITLYLTSPSFDEANERGKKIISLLGDFSPENIRRLLTKVNQHGQVRGSYQLASVIINLRHRMKNFSAQEFEELLINNGLEEFSVKEDDPF